MSLVSVMTGFRQNPVGVPNFVVTILCYSLGKFMASVLPSNLRVRGTRIKISINPGPFNIKEHLLSTVIFSSGLGTMPAANLYAATRAYFRISIHPMAFFFLLLTTNVSMKHPPNFWTIYLSILFTGMNLKLCVHCFHFFH